MKKNDANKIVESPNLAVLGAEHTNKWVALTPDYKKLLAVGDSLKSVLEAAGSYAEKVVIKVMPNLGYAPLTS